MLDADKYEVGSNRDARRAERRAMRQVALTHRRRHPPRPDRVAHARCGSRSGEKLSFGTYFNAFPASYWRRWTVVDEVRLARHACAARAPP